MANVQNTLSGIDLFIQGVLQATTLVPSAGCVSNVHVNASAGIVYSKLEHLHRALYAQPNTAATSATQAVYVVRGATATALSVVAGSIAAAVGNATVTVDVKKNGSTIMSSVITLDSGNANYTPEVGTIADGALVAGDVLTIVIVATIGSGTLPTGLYVGVKIKEDAQ